jgi:hypothetical protein
MGTEGDRTWMTALMSYKGGILMAWLPSKQVPEPGTTDFVQRNLTEHMMTRDNLT